MATLRIVNIAALFYIATAITFVVMIATLVPNWFDIKNMNKQKENMQISKRILDFPYQWCRLERWRFDWKGMLGQCSRQMSWEDRNPGSPDRTSSEKSFISRWELSPAGHFSRFWIQSVNAKGQLKGRGGDSWRVYIREGQASLAPIVIDHQNGRYEVLLLVTEPGLYNAQIYLDYTLCDGFRDPPKTWFTIGTVQGKYQKDGVLGYIGDDYINKPLSGKNDSVFRIKKSTDLDNQGFFEYCGNYSEGLCTFYKKPIPLCQEGKEKCPLLWNGHGQWIKGQWRSYFPGVNEKRNITAMTSVRKSGTLWILGDSISSRFLDFVKGRLLCTQIFNECKKSYNWVYQLEDIHAAKTKYDSKDFNSSIILNQFREIISRPDMNHSESAFVFNMGVHYPITLNFTTFTILMDDVIRLLVASGDVNNWSKASSLSNLAMQQEKKGRSTIKESFTREERKHILAKTNDKRVRRFGDIFEERKAVKSYIIWKTTTAIEKEKTDRFRGGLNLTSMRFFTYQRVQLYQLYANSVMCQAGVPLLDVYPISAAYADGTIDAVHYPSDTFLTVAEVLEKFLVQERMRAEEKFDPIP